MIAEIRAGRIVVLVDDEDRENEGDLVLAAEHVTPEAVNFMAKHARGLVCLTLTEERCRQWPSWCRLARANIHRVACNPANGSWTRDESD